jgi:uncharacterized membrane protein (DUF485 family)
MHHEPTSTIEKDGASDAKARLGLILFGAYSLVYVGFVLINTFSPKWMGITVFAGLNLAVVYGFGLIILAIILGLIYHAMCNRMEDQAAANLGDNNS